MAKEIIITDELRSIEKIEEIVKQGNIPVCKRCKAQLIVTTNRESAKEKSIHPGIYCPNNINHFCIMIELWDQEAKTLYDKIMNIGNKDDSSGD